MACASSLLFLSLLLMATATSRGQTTAIQGLSATGSLCCTSIGNCPGPTVVGAVARLRCPTRLGGTAVIGLNTTDTNGFFNITGPITPAWSSAALPTWCAGSTCSSRSAPPSASSSPPSPAASTAASSPPARWWRRRSASCRPGASRLSWGSDPSIERYISFDFVAKN